MKMYAITVERHIDRIVIHQPDENNFDNDISENDGIVYISPDQAKMVCKAIMQVSKEIEVKP